MDLSDYLCEIDNNEKKFIAGLKRWVEIKSVSGDTSFRKGCFEMVDEVSKDLKDLGFSVEIVDNPKGKQKTIQGEDVDLPPLILAELHQDPSYKTILIYGHIDVQPAKKSDGWKYEPFTLTIEDGIMYGRGSTDDKGPVYGWLAAVETLTKLKKMPKLNLKFCLEAMEEAGSEGLEELVLQERDKFFADIDFICISDNYWLGTTKPCLTYGLRGVLYFQVMVSGSGQDLHSGIYGGSVYEPMIDLMAIFSKLIDGDGKILIPNIYDDMAAVTDEELSINNKIDFDIESFKKSIGVKKLRSNDKVESLMQRWRYPSLSIHGIEGAFDAPGEKTVIPKQVIGKFSIRMVPYMEVDKIEESVTKYLEGLHKKLNSSTDLTVSLSHGSTGWVTDYKNSNFVAAKEALKKVFNVEPDFTREGGSIPIAMFFEKVIGKSVLLLPMGRGDDGAHSQNEKLDIENFIKGIKVFGLYLHELAKL